VDDFLLTAVKPVALSSGCLAVESGHRENAAASLIQPGKPYVPLNHHSLCSTISRNKPSSWDLKLFNLCC